MAEKKMGYKLPKRYLELLSFQNGGYIRYTLPGIPHSQIFGIGPYFPSITDFEWLYEYEGYGLEIRGLFPFDGDGHWNICLDYRKNKEEPEITFVDIELISESPIAKNFEEYISKLIIETENEYVIEVNVTLEDTIKFISTAINCDFGKPDLFAHGYPIYRCKHEGNWIWISPNKVQSGFIRREDPRYEELKEQMETQSLRFPEIDENAILLTFSNKKHAVELTSLLKNCGLIIKELRQFVD